MSYEFSAEENSAMNTLYMRYLVIGILIAIVEIIYLSFSTFDASHIIQGVLVIGGAVIFVLPFLKFKTIVQTQGSDIEVLMKALKQMAITFMVIAVLVLLNLIVMIVSM